MPRHAADLPLREIGLLRERQILHHVARGKTNAQIAWQLGISAETIRKHLENVYEKLGVHTRTGAVAALFGLDVDIA